MELTCVACGQAIEAGDYQLVGVEKQTWISRYAHRGMCEAEAREQFQPKRATKRKTKPKAAAPAVEELSLDLELPAEQAETPLPWFGMERRR